MNKCACGCGRSVKEGKTWRVGHHLKGRAKSIKETGIEVISMPKKQAEREWKNFREVLVRRQEKYLMDTYHCLVQMKKGRKLIDIYEVFKQFGVSTKEEPKLAIARADWKKVFFHKRSEGRGKFSDKFSEYQGGKESVYLPNETFKEWTKEEKRNWIANERLETKVPIVPVQFLPRGKLNNYYILWEVKEWKAVPKDPLLLKRITNNLFAVLAVWDLTPLEQSIIRGRT